MYSSDTLRASLLAALLLLFLWPAAQAQSVPLEAGEATKLGERAPGEFGGDVLIFDQTDTTTGNGTVAQYNDENSQFDVLLADDFTVPNGLTYAVNTFAAAGFYTGGATTGDCERANVIVWSSTDDGEPDAQLFTFDDIEPSVDTGAPGAIGFLFVDVPTVTLSSGTYWFTVACEGDNLDVVNGGRWNWARSNGNEGFVSQIRNDGGGFGIPPGWNNSASAVNGNDRSFAFFGQESGTALFPELTVEQGVLTATAPPDGMATRILTLRNTGDDVLTYSLPEFDGPDDATVRNDVLTARFAGYPTMVLGADGSAYSRTGSDNSGYVFRDNDEDDGPEFDFTDISGTGTPLGAGDDSVLPVTLPFPFTFYGDVYTDVNVLSNGFLSFLDGPYGTFNGAFNAAIPSPAVPNAIIAPFWDDLRPGSESSGDIYAQDMGDGRFIVQWEEIARFADRNGGTGVLNTFQVVLFEDGAIEFYYEDINAVDDGSATVGIENADGTDALQVALNEAGYIQDGRAIRIVRDLSVADFITDADPTSGTLQPGEDVNITVTFDAEGLSVGEYNDTIEIESNAGDVTVAAVLRVVGPPEIFVDPLLLEATLDSGETETRPITITNTGLEDLEFSFAGYSNAAAQAVPNFGPRSKVDLDKGEDGASNGAQSFGAGGPDGFGYVWVDSNEDGGPAADFQDISDSGVEITDTDWTATGTFDPADEGFFVVDLPFAFPYYGEEQTELTVSTNGFAAFSEITANTFTNQAIPVAALPNGILAPFWDDFNLVGATGSVFYGLTDDGRFAIQWEGVARFAATEVNTFQIILGEDGTIAYQYASLGSPTLNAATVGIENLDGTDGLQIAFNEAYLESDFAVLIAVESPLVSNVSPASGVVAPGESVTVTATVSAVDLFAGTYEDDLQIISNDPVRPVTTVAVEVTVTGDPAVSIDPMTIGFGEVMLGGSATETVTVTNTGTDVLTITGISSDDDAFDTSTASSTTIQPGQTATFTVTFEPDELSTYSGTITVSTDAGDVTVSVAGVASPAPVASVTPESLDPSSADEVDELVLMNDGVGTLTYEVTATSMTRLPSGGSPATPTVTGNAALSLLTAGENATSTPPVMAGASAAPGDVLFSAAFTAGASPLGITQSTDGTVYVADINAGTTSVYDADLNSLGTIPNPTIAGNLTAGVAYNANTETLWFQSTNTGSFASTLLEANLDGSPTGNSITLPNTGGLATGVEFSPELGWYFYVDISNDDIVAVDQTGALVDGYPVDQTDGDDGSGNFGNGLDVLGGGLDVVFGASTGTQSTDAVVTDLLGNNVGATTPFAQTGDTFVNDVTRSRIAPNEIMYVVGNSSGTIYAIEPAFRDDVDGGGGGGGEADYITVNPSSGTVGPAQNTTLTVTYDDEDLEAGTYMAMIVISTNDPENPTLQVPVTLVVSSAVSNEDSAQPTVFELSASVPNPTMSRTALRYAVPETSDVLIEVYDLMGRRVATLVDGEEAAGRKTVQWDASSLAGGVYVYRMTAGSFSQTLKMVVVR